MLVRRVEDMPGVLSGRRYRSMSFVSVPVLVDDEPRGVLNVADHEDGRPFEQSAVQTLQILAGHIGAVLVQQEQGEALRRLAETDPLTWLFNRRHFDRRLEGETNRALRAEHLLAQMTFGRTRFVTVTHRHTDLATAVKTGRFYFDGVARGQLVQQPTALLGRDPQSACQFREMRSASRLNKGPQDKVVKLSEAFVHRLGILREKRTCGPDAFRPRKPHQV